VEGWGRVDGGASPDKTPRKPTKEELAEALRHYPTWGHAMVAAQDEVVRLRQERDNWEKLAKEWEAWLDDALEALGAKTVFDIKGGQK
jgi:hypothetical protein